MMMMIMLFISLESCDRMVTGLHLTSYLAPGAWATAAGVHTVIAQGVLLKQQDIIISGSANFLLLSDFTHYFILHMHYYNYPNIFLWWYKLKMNAVSIPKPLYSKRWWMHEKIKFNSEITFWISVVSLPQFHRWVWWTHAWPLQ